MVPVVQYHWQDHHGKQFEGGSHGSGEQDARLHRLSLWSVVRRRRYTAQSLGSVQFSGSGFALVTETALNKRPLQTHLKANKEPSSRGLGGAQKSALF